MTESIIVAFISGGLTLLGVIILNNKHKKEKLTDDIMLLKIKFVILYATKL